MNLHIKDHLSSMTSKTEKFKVRSHGMIKKTIIATLVVSTISINTAFAESKNPTNLKKIYHVYINEEYLGTVSNKDMINELVNKKVEEVKDQYKDFDLSFKTDEVTFVPEQIFRTTNVADEEVLNEIDREYGVNVEAAALKIDGEVVTYLENQQKIEEAIRNLKLKYVSEKELAQFEKQQASSDEQANVSKDESQIIDIRLSKNVTVALEEVKPEQVLQVQDVVKLLQKGTIEEEKYVVKEGDVLGSIAQDHGLKLKQLLDLNTQLTEDTMLQIGDELNVAVHQPYIDVIVDKKVSSTEKLKYETETIEDKNMYKGDTKVVQKGSDGEKEVTYVVSLQNGNQIKKDVVEEKVTKEPVKHIVRKGTKVETSRGTGSFVWPTNGGYVSSRQGYRWGRQHKGIDIARPSDRTIKSVDNGVVVSAGWDGGYGNKIVIDHKNGLKTVYAHLSSIHVSVGQTVSQGKKIGTMGSTGHATGVHLHFEVYKNGSLQNPLNYLR